jgi:hypothetical protein
MMRLLVLVALLSGCGSSPTAPELPRSPLVPGTYLITVGASDTAQTCVGPLDAWSFFGPTVAGKVTLLANGLGRSPSAADGTVEMQLDNAPVGAAAVTGTVSGRLAHAAGVFGNRSAAFAATTGGGSARVNLDRVDGIPPVYVGTITGTISFTAADGSVVTCPQAVILLSPDR